MRTVLLLLAAAPAFAAPERLPPPREARFDIDGTPLPDGALMRYGSRANGHPTAVSIWWSPDGKKVVTDDTKVGGRSFREWNPGRRLARAVVGIAGRRPGEVGVGHAGWPALRRDARPRPRRV